MMNHIKQAIQAGIMTPRQANKEMRDRYPHNDLREQPFQHITMAAVCAVERAWASNRFCVAAYRHNELGYVRLSINRTSVDNEGEWKAGITWDEIQQIKSECGYGDKYAVELFPPDDKVINVANIRHIVLLDEPPIYAWDEDDYRKKSRANGFIPEDELPSENEVIEEVAP